MLKLIAGLWTGIGAMIAAIFAIATRKLGVVTAGLAAFALLVTAFVAGINSLVQFVGGLVATSEAALSGWLLSFVGIFIPGNFGLVLSSIVASRICRAAYDLGRQKTQLIVYGN